MLSIFVLLGTLFSQQVSSLSAEDSFLPKMQEEVAPLESGPISRKDLILYAYQFSQGLLEGLHSSPEKSVCKNSFNSLYLYLESVADVMLDCLVFDHSQCAKIGRKTEELETSLKGIYTDCKVDEFIEDY